MSAVSEFFKPAGPAFSPACAARPTLVFGAANDDDYDCRTPTGTMIPYLREATTCPPAPRKPPPPPPAACKKRLFAESSTVISFDLDELERLYRPHPPPANDTDKQRRSVNSHGAA